jgi:hypothetical protein
VPATAAGIRSVAQQALVGDEDQHADEHSDAGGGEGPAPPEPVAEQRGHEVAHEGPDVDAHVEDVVAGILQRAALRVQPAYERRHVGLEETVADHDHAQGQKERVGTGNRQHQVTDPHQGAADNDRLAIADLAVGENAAEERRQVHQRDERPVHLCGGLVAESETADHGVPHVQHQDSEHEVVPEPLPHFGEEQRLEAGRVVSEHRCLLSGRVSGTVGSRSRAAPNNNVGDGFYAGFGRRDTDSRVAHSTSAVHDMCWWRIRCLELWARSATTLEVDDNLGKARR